MELVVPRTDAENQFLCNWAAKIIGQDEFKNARGLGFADHNGIVAVVVLHDLSPPNVFLSWASTSPRWFTKRTIFIIYDWIFNQHKCQRVTGLVEKNNKRARKIDEGLGMRLEGVLRKASPSGQDLMIYGLLRKEADELIRKLYATHTKNPKPIQAPSTRPSDASGTSSWRYSIRGRISAHTEGRL